MSTILDFFETRKKTIIFLCKQDGTNLHPIATGFVVGIDNIPCIVTSRHVARINSLILAYNTKDKQVRGEDIDRYKEKNDLDWFYHNNDNVDIAMIPFPFKDADVFMVTQDYFLDFKILFETLNVFFISYQPGISLENRVSPIFRRGSISRILEGNTFYIDGFAFPGNSGSPVFLSPTITYSKDGIQLKKYILGGKLIGVIGQFLTIQNQNTGLSKVWSINFINDIIDSKKFQDQLDVIKSKIRKS